MLSQEDNFEFFEYFYNIFQLLLERLIKLQPEMLLPNQWYILARLFLALKRYDQGQICAENAIQSCGEIQNFQILNTLGELYFYQENYQKALDIFTEILKISPDDIRVKEIYNETCWFAMKCPSIPSIESINLQKKIDDIYDQQFSRTLWLNQMIKNDNFGLKEEVVRFFK
jgi:tetratricopeptide (TPR) repeat protein